MGLQNRQTKFASSVRAHQREVRESNMKKSSSKQKPIDFSKGVRGKYAGMKIVIAGPADQARASKASKRNAEAVLKQVSRVLSSAGSSKRELESAIDHARELIDSTS
jgi:hypothetical protein